MNPPSSEVRPPPPGSAPALEFHLLTGPLVGKALAPYPVPTGVSRFAGREPAFPEPVVLEPVRQQRGQLRLLARFWQAGAAQVNGEAAPSTVVLAPGDWFRCGAGPVVRVALFNRPQLGPPPASALGKPCPFCKVPFTTATTCLTCPCGVVVHCEPDEKDGLHCAQELRVCPVCKRTLSQDEAYVNPGGSDE